MEALPADKIKVNELVKVKLGQALINGTITEINKEEIHVILATGMQVKIKADSLYSI